MLTKKYGPLPLWAWLAIVAVALFFLYKRHAQTQTTTTPTTGAGSIPTETVELPTGTYYSGPVGGFTGSAGGGGGGSSASAPSRGTTPGNISASGPGSPTSTTPSGTAGATTPGQGGTTPGSSSSSPGRSRGKVAPGVYSTLTTTGTETVPRLVNVGASEGYATVAGRYGPTNEYAYVGIYPKTEGAARYTGAPTAEYIKRGAA